MRKDQVVEFLNHAGRDLVQVERQYEKALDEKKIPASLQIDVINLMENLRSALDYMAHDVYETIIMPVRNKAGKKAIKKTNFPYGKTENDFKSMVGSYLPNLYLLAPRVYSVIEALQPHKSGDNWLCDFCEILNEGKHDTLSPQRREEKRGLKVNFSGDSGISMGAGASISGTGTIRSGHGKITLDNEKISGDSPARNVSGRVAQTIVRWISFKFSNTDTEVLPFLKKALNSIEQLFNDLYSEL